MNIGETDNDLVILQDIKDSVAKIDIQYRLADFNGKKKLRKIRDRAFNAYSQARLELLEEGVISSKEDVAAMKELRKQVENAANIETLFNAATKLLRFLVTLGV